MAQARTRTMTADDLLALPGGMGERYELIEGELIVTAAAGGKHGLVAQIIGGEIYVFLKENPIGVLVTAETGFYTRGDDKTVRAPDLAFMRNELIPPGGLPDGYLSIVPDLVVEVVSPNDRAAEVDAKVQEWLDFGVGAVWVAYPATRRFMVYRRGADSAVILNAGDKIDGGAILPGIEREVTIFFDT
jgi:Uma2 family endonuclease